MMWVVIVIWCFDIWCNNSVRIEVMELKVLCFNSLKLEMGKL